MSVSPVNADGALTPNYGNEITPETVGVEFDQLIHPVGGEEGNFIANDIFNKVTTSGDYLNRFHSTGFSWDEVGTINLVAKVGDDDYLKTGWGLLMAVILIQLGVFILRSIRWSARYLKMPAAF